MSRKYYQIEVEVSNANDSFKVTCHASASSKRFAIKAALKDFTPEPAHIANQKINRYLAKQEEAVSFESNDQRFSLIVTKITQLNECQYQTGDGEMMMGLILPTTTQDEATSQQGKKPFLANINICLDGHNDFDRYIVWAIDEKQARKQAILSKLPNKALVKKADKFLDQQLELGTNSLSFRDHHIEYQLKQICKLEMVLVDYQSNKSFMAVLMENPNIYWSHTGKNVKQQNLICRA